MKLVIPLLLLLAQGMNADGTLWAADFSGWGGVRVAEQKGGSRVMRSIDTDADGRDEIVVVNPRYSRLDVYRYRLPAERAGQLDDANLPDPDDANFLPLAIELKHEEIQLEQLPIDVVAMSGRDSAKLVVLVNAPERLLVLDRNGQGKWEVSSKVDLLDGKIVARHKSLQLESSLARAESRLLIACEKGYQAVVLGDQPSVKWLQPREERALADWWITDVDGDGHQDILEQRRALENAVCWLRGDGSGAYQPARELHDRMATDVRALQGYEKTPVILLDDKAEGMVRRYEMQQGKDTRLGKVQPLPIESGTVWTSMLQGDRKMLVAASPNSPLLRTFELDQDGWNAGPTFPTLGNVQKMVSPQAKADTLLLWCKDASDLVESRWDGTRLTYPKTWKAEDSSEGDRLVALGEIGATTWWAKVSGKTLKLFLWEPGSEKPRGVEFAGIGASIEDVLWIGDARVLIKEKRARGLGLAQVGEDGKTKVTEPSSLQRSELDEFRVYEIDGKLSVARLTDGVVQWLNGELEPFDQVMLSDSAEIEDFLPDGLASGWAVDAVAEVIHRLQPDETGIAKEVERYQVAQAEALVYDDVLGLMATSRNRLTCLSKGAREELIQVEALNQKKRRTGGSGLGSCDRFLVADIDLDGREELLLCDDEEHRVSVMRLGDSLEHVVSWKVFEDMAYPYGGGEFGDASGQREPRAVLPLDIDGDENADLAMLCHDRLVIYFGKAPE